MNKENLYKEEQELLNKLSKTSSTEEQEIIKRELSRINEALRFVDKDE